MIIDNIKISCYLDEAGDDLDSACKFCNNLNINYIILRNNWYDDINTLTGDSYKLIKNALNLHGLSTIGICYDIKYDIANHLNIVDYFDSQLLLIKVNHVEELYKIANDIEFSCSNFIPIVEFTNGLDLDLLIKFLNNHKNWKVLFDPVRLIINNFHDVIKRYFNKLSDFIFMVNVIDYKVNYGMKIIGSGDVPIDSIVRTFGENYCGWYVLKPSFNKSRFIDNQQKSNILKMSKDAFVKIISKV